MSKPANDHRQAGVAMVLVLISVAMAVILSLSFLNAQVTATGMAQNMGRRAQAHALAESGMTMALAYIETTTNWRTQMAHGTWVTDHPFAGGSFTIIGEDGQDTDGDGIPDGDADLADDDADLVTLTSIGTFDGVSQKVHAVVTPRPPKTRLLMVVPNPANLDGEEKARRVQFEDWDYVVTLIGATDTQAAFDNAVANADVVYIPENVASTNVDTKLRNAPVGVISEEANLNDSFGLATADGPSYSGYTQIDVTNNTHFITEPLATGLVQIIASSSVELRYFGGTMAGGVVVLATRSASSTPVLIAVEAGGTLVDSSSAAGRRVSLPWGGNVFNWSQLTPAGLTIARRSLEWASQPAIAGQIAHWDLDETTGTTAGDSVGGMDGIHRNGVTLGQPGAYIGSTGAQFDGANDHVEIPHNNALLLDEGTFAFWFQTGTVSAEQGLISKDSTGYDTGGHMSIRMLNDDHIGVRLQSVDTSYSLKSTGACPSVGTWYHVAFTFGPGGMKLYVDGVLVDSDAYTGGMGTTSGGAGNFEPMAFGVLTVVSGDLTLTGWTMPLLGVMDDVYAFSRALAEPEIQQLMQVAGAAGGLSYDVRWNDQP